VENAWLAGWVKLQIPPGHFAAYIFDCDGTLADTMPLHFVAWTQAMQDFDGCFPEHLFYEWGGKPTAVIVEQLNVLYGTSLDVELVTRRKEDYFVSLIPRVKEIESVVQIASDMFGRLPMAVASGGHHELVDATLEALGITHLFSAVVCAEDYAHGKPAPDPFLEAARRLGVVAGECLAFEDSPTGIESARAAGMATVLVPREEVAATMT